MLRSPTPARSIALVAAASLASAASAQHALDWLQTHDGPQTQADYGRACATDALGNVYVAGRSYNPSVGIPPPPPEADFETVAYSPSGAVLWVQRLDGYGSEDFALDVAVAPSGDVYVAGYSWNGTGIDAALIKYSVSGAHQWTRFFAGPGGGSDFARAIAFDAAGNAIVGGSGSGAASQSDLMALSYSPAGALNWWTLVDGGALGTDSGYALAILSTGEIALAGQAATAAGSDAVVTLFSAGGGELWTEALDGGAALADAFYALGGAGSQRIVAAGMTTTSANGEDAFVAELDRATGAVLWSRTYDGPAHGNDRARAGGIARDGTAWFASSSPGTGTGVDVATLRFDASGTALPALRWNGSANLDDFPVDLALGSAGQAWVAGYTTLVASPLDTDVTVLQYDSAGSLSWQASYTTPGAFDDRPFDAELAPNERIALAGYTTGGGTGTYDYLAVQVDAGASPHGYCTAKTTAIGCVPLLTFEGMPSASAASGFTLRCSGVRNEKFGLFFYGLNGASAAPFQGGTMCVQWPVARTPIQSSGGNPLPADDCSGLFVIDMNAFAAGALPGSPLAGLSLAGQRVWVQVWGRDPGFLPPNNSMLSSALRYEVLP